MTCTKCKHEQRFFYHRPESGDKEARCWHEDEDGFCGCRCEYGLMVHCPDCRTTHIFGDGSCLENVNARRRTVMPDYDRKLEEWLS